MAQTETKKKNLPLYITAGVLACAAIGTGIYSMTANHSDSESGSPAGDVQVIAADQSLVIPVGEVGETAQFYPIDVDGTAMEVLAIRDSGGRIRTAFNTCQSCYTSGRGYYVANGSTLICQNCGFQFTADQVETAMGGCNPYPIFPENKAETEESISISYDFLKASAAIFANWKVGA